MYSCTSHDNWIIIKGCILSWVAGASEEGPVGPRRSELDLFDNHTTYPENCSQTHSATSLIMNITKPLSNRRIRSQELLKTTNTTSQILMGTLKYQRVKQRSARTSFLNSPNLILSPSTQRLVKVVINTIILFALCQKIMDVA